MERPRRHDRYVSLRPAPDTMTILTAHLPLAQGIAAYTNVDRHARQLRATGDERSLNQIKADTLVERLTGQPHATTIPIHLNLLITDTTLLADPTRPSRRRSCGWRNWGGRYSRWKWCDQRGGCRGFVASQRN